MLDDQRARGVVLLSAVINVTLGLLFLLVGTALFVFYNQPGGAGLPGRRVLAPELAPRRRLRLRAAAAPTPSHAPHRSIAGKLEAGSGGCRCGRQGQVRWTIKKFITDPA